MGQPGVNYGFAAAIAYRRHAEANASLTTTPTKPAWLRRKCVGRRKGVAPRSPHHRQPGGVLARPDAWGSRGSTTVSQPPSPTAAMPRGQRQPHNHYYEAGVAAAEVC